MSLNKLSLSMARLMWPKQHNKLLPPKAIGILSHFPSMASATLFLSDLIALDVRNNGLECKRQLLYVH